MDLIIGSIQWIMWISEKPATEDRFCKGGLFGRQDAATCWIQLLYQSLIVHMPIGLTLHKLFSLVKKAVENRLSH